MLNRLKGVVANSKKNENSEGKPTLPKGEKFVYGRPYFLGLNKDEVENSRDFGLRPIFIPRNKDKTHTLPFFSGYAECINGGKSNYNEDNSYACTLRLCRQKKNGPNSDATQQYSSPVWPDSTSGHTKRRSSHSDQDCCLGAEYFGVFDGHAGYHVSVIVSRLLHKHLQDKLQACLDYLLQNEVLPSNSSKQVTVDHLVIGALEEAFAEMDDQLEREGSNFEIKGGCTALVALFLLNKLYIANAGDCRGVLCHGETVTQLTRDFNPDSERQRINYIGYCHPELLYNEFSCIEYIRRLNKNDLGKWVLCRKPDMEGWTTKYITEEDLKFPLVTGEGRKARLMGTIGVTRGLGDHDLYVYDTDICIKPFLSSQPEVTVLDLSDKEWTEEDMLILGSDGLWDGVTKEEAEGIARKAIQPQNKEDNLATRYTIAAQDLVCEAKGVFTGRGWRKRDDTQASFDDITAFVIPIKPAVKKADESEARSETRSETKQDMYENTSKTYVTKISIGSDTDNSKIDNGDTEKAQNDVMIKPEQTNTEHINEDKGNTKQEYAGQAQEDKEKAKAEQVEEENGNTKQENAGKVKELKDLRNEKQVNEKQENTEIDNTKQETFAQPNEQRDSNQENVETKKVQIEKEENQVDS